MNAKTKEEFIGVIIEVSSKKEKIKLNDKFFLTYKLINRSDRKISLFIKDIENNMYLQFIGRLMSLFLCEGILESDIYLKWNHKKIL